jgi:hypothetical protein
VADAWEKRQCTPRQQPARGETPEQQRPRSASSTFANDRPIATVDGRPIPRGEVLNLLLRSHGPGILEQLIVLRCAERLALERGLAITPADVKREYDHALRRLVDPVLGQTSGSFDRQAAERVLNTVLSERNISHEEFMIGMRRNAYLRALVQADMEISERQLRDEYARAYSERVQVRHIQLATLREADRVRGLMAAGESFDDLARRFSANTITAKEGGLLEPFSRYDEAVPAVLRDTAFQLEPGQVSDALRAGAWYHLMKLERRLPPHAVGFDQVRLELETAIRERRTEPAMQELYEQLFEEADVHIHEPALREAFDAKHADQRRRQAASSSQPYPR